MTDKLVLQFSTAAQNWRWWVPPFLRCNTSIPCLSLDKNWMTGLIRRANHSPFSHVDMVTARGLLGASDQGEKSPCIDGNPCGVALRPFDYQRFAYRREMVLFTDRADDVYKAAYSQLGKPFDKGSIFDFVSDKFPGHRNWRKPDKWFCAELVIWSLEEGGFWREPLRWPKNRVSPTDVIMTLLTDDRWINRDAFWLPIPNLALGPNER